MQHYPRGISPLDRKFDYTASKPLDIRLVWSVSEHYNTKNPVRSDTKRSVRPDRIFALWCPLQFIAVLLYSRGLLAILCFELVISQCFLIDIFEHDGTYFFSIFPTQFFIPVIHIGLTKYHFCNCCK